MEVNVHIDDRVTVATEEAFVSFVASHRTTRALELDRTRLRAAVLAFHELRAGREPIVATPGAASTGLRFPSDESIAFGAFSAAAVSESAIEGARFAVGEASASRFVWTTHGLRTSRPTDAAELGRIARRVETLHVALQVDIDVALAEIDLVPARERGEVLAFAEAEIIDLAGFHVATEFLARAREDGARAAIVQAGKTSTYDALARRAHAFANAFRASGIGTGDVVGIGMQTSVDAVAAILGAYWVGAAYLPLDPEYPAARLETMASDAGAKVIVAEATHAWFPSGARHLAPSDVTPSEADWTSAPVTKGDLAYVIYTSGSTGKPKGVRVSHRNVGKDLRGMQRLCALSRDDVFQSIFSLSFDVSITEILFPLILGAVTHIIPKADVLDGVRMRAHFEKNRPTVALVPRFLWEALFEAGYAGDPKLRSWTGGEQMRRPMAVRASALVGALYNCYGPTEATVHAAVHRFTPSDEEPIPFGRPLPNVSVFVLDGRQRLQPFGFAGELYIGGEGLAEGYHRLPELTAEKFPVLEIGGRRRRLYRTGDVVRMRPTGVLEFAGRRDDQVKVRGYRVELGEVETALRQVSGVRDAIALVHDEAIVAYVIVRDDAIADRDFAALRTSLARVLPQFMLPSHYIALASFPVTVNAKVDVEKLPKPVVRTEPAVDDNASLRAIARTALGLPNLEDSDDFRDLGATSLSLVRLAGAMRKGGWKIGVADLYEHPSVAALAVFLAAKRAAAPPPAPAVPASPAPPATRAPSGPPPAPSPVRPPLDDAAVRAASAPLHVRVETPAYRWLITKSLAFPLLRTIVNHPQTAAINAVRYTFGSTPDLAHLRAVWVSLAEDIPVLRGRLDFGTAPAMVVEPDVELPFELWDARDLTSAGYDWRVREVERIRKERGADVKAWPYHTLDVVLGPNGESALILSNAQFLMDLETLEDLVRQLWRRYEEGIPPVALRPARGPQPTPFEEEDEEGAAGDSGAVFHEMLAGIARPTRLPFDAIGLSVDGITTGLKVLGRYARTLGMLARAPDVKNLLEAASSGEEQKVTLSGVARAVTLLSAGRATSGLSFFGSVVRDRVSSRARELRVTEHAVILSALGLLVARWTGHPDVLIRMLIANRDFDKEGAPAARRTRDVPLRVVIDPDATVEELITTTHRWVTKILDHQNASREVYLEALPFPEPFTHVIYVAGEAPDLGPPPSSLSPKGFFADELLDGVFLAAIALERGEVAFHWDAMFIRDATARSRLDEFVALLALVAGSPQGRRLRALG